MSIGQLFENTDWELLRKQKERLVYIDSYITLETEEDADIVAGIINFLDSIMDCAADNYLTDKIVFGDRQE